MSGPFTDTWNAAYEGVPGDGENVSLGASRIRDTKVSVRERFSVDHSLNGDASDGYHNWVTFLQNANDPATQTPQSGLAASLYAKVINAHLELCFRNDQGGVTQLTSAGALNTYTIPSGTKMLFAQAAAPTGWTQDTDQSDRVLRVTNSTGALTGGSWTISGVTTLGYTLQVADIPSHTHGVAEVGSNAGAGVVPIATNNTTRTTTMTSDATGGGGSHSHGVSADGTWRPAYLDILKATKN